MIERWRSNTELAEEGMRALIERLGVSDAIRFMQQVSPGTGDFTAERQASKSAQSLDEIVRRIEDQRQNLAG